MTCTALFQAAHFVVSRRLGLTDNEPGVYEDLPSAVIETLSGAAALILSGRDLSAEAESDLFEGHEILSVCGKGSDLDWWIETSASYVSGCWPAIERVAELLRLGETVGDAIVVQPLTHD